MAGTVRRTRRLSAFGQRDVSYLQQYGPVKPEGFTGPYVWRLNRQRPVISEPMTFSLSAFGPRVIATEPERTSSMMP